MVHIEVDYEGELHTRCDHGPSGARIATDAPVDNQGRGESFSPTDLLATALGSCMLTVMGIASQASDRSWKLEGARASIEKHMASEPRRVSRLVVDLHMPAGLPEEARSVLEQAARTCPVAQSIHPGIDLDCRFHWA